LTGNAVVVKNVQLAVSQFTRNNADILAALIYKVNLL